MRLKRVVEGLKNLPGVTRSKGMMLFLLQIPGKRVTVERKY